LPERSYFQSRDSVAGGRMGGRLFLFDVEVKEKVYRLGRRICEFHLGAVGVANQCWPIARSVTSRCRGTHVNEAGMTARCYTRIRSHDPRPFM